MVTSGGVLADVGTDHGYIPIALLEKHRIVGAIAMDINEGPLARAKEHIAEAGLGEYIQTRLSDGVQALKVQEADSILIAGMGGELVIHILKEGDEVCASAAELILQPQSEIRRVREFLRLHRYRIVDEDMVCEDGKYYPMMRVIHVDTDESWSKMNEESRTVCDIYGPLLLRNGHPVLRRFLVRQHRQLTELLQRLRQQKQTEAIGRRISELQQELSYNESAYTILGAIKNAGI